MYEGDPLTAVEEVLWTLALGLANMFLEALELGIIMEAKEVVVAKSPSGIVATLA